jgi:hypothetical protein
MLESAEIDQRAPGRSCREIPYPVDLVQEAIVYAVNDEFAAASKLQPMRILGAMHR